MANRKIAEVIKTLAQALTTPDVEVVGLRTNLARYRIPVGPERDALNRSIHRLAAGKGRIGTLAGKGHERRG